MSEQNNNIKVLLVKPMRTPEVVEIGNDLKDLQKTVGGSIEAVYPFPDRVALVSNEEAKFNGLPLNRALRDEDGHIYDILAGDFFICAVSGEEFTSLSDEQIQKFSERFKDPEIFIPTGWHVRG